MFAFIIQFVIAMAVSMAIGYATRRRPPGVKAAGRDQFKLPTAREDRTIPFIGGKRRIEGPNVVTPVIDFVTKPIRVRSDMFGGHTTVGHQYFVGLQMGVCQAADGILQVWGGDTCLWPTALDPTDEAVDSTTIASVSAWAVWGGKKGEGGFVGTIRFAYGGDAQTAAAYLILHMGAAIPASRGFVSAILERCYIGTQPYLKPMSFLAKRTLISPERTGIWYPSKAVVNDEDLNAIHCLREWIVSPTIGRGKGDAAVGPTFAAAADTCYTEGMGFSYVCDQPDQIMDMVETALQIIGGILYTDRETGRFEIALARDDYDPADLDTYGEDDLWVSEFHRPSPAKVPSKTIVLWHDKRSCQSRPAYDDDVALLTRQGSIPITQTLDYSAFICDPDLALYVAAREQQAAARMGALLTIHCDRRMSRLHPGDVFKLSYPELGIVSMVVRVLRVDYGSLADGEITMDLVEDIYGQAYTVYGTPPHSAVIDRIVSPQGDGFPDIDDENALEASSRIEAETAHTETGPY